MTYPGLSMWDGSSEIYYFIDFWPSFRSEAVEDRNVTFNQIQGSSVKCPLPMNGHPLWTFPKVLIKCKSYFQLPAYFVEDLDSFVSD
jgi:hypothetical protein